MKKLFFCIIFFSLFLIVSCDKSNGENNTNVVKKSLSPPSFVALTNGDSKLVFLDNKLNIINEVNNNNKFNNFTINESANILYALDDGTYMGTPPAIIIIDLLNLKIKKKITLPSIPSNFLIVGNTAYIASSEMYNEGMPFFTVDLSNGKIKEKSFTKGMVNVVKQYNNEIYVGINSGGIDSFGEFSNIYKMQIIDTNINFIPVIKDNIELPPSDFVIENNKLYSIFSGFSYGPKPDWIKEPERYTNKFMVINMTNGKIEVETKLSKPFPQRIISVEDRFYINNYTDIDMRGEFMTVINKSDLKESFISINNPAYFDYNDELKGFLISDPKNGTLQFMKDGKITKKIKVGENSSIVTSVQK